MIISIRTMLLSHGIVFIGGCVFGKMINQDELETYRTIHESGITKFRRNATTAALTILSISTLYFVVRIASSNTTGTTTTSTRVVRDQNV